LTVAMVPRRVMRSGGRRSGLLASSSTRSAERCPIAGNTCGEEALEKRRALATAANTATCLMDAVRRLWQQAEQTPGLALGANLDAVVCEPELREADKVPELVR